MAKNIALATIAMHNMPGGLEKNIAYLANELCNQGHNVKLLTFDLPNAKSFYELDERVIWTPLGRTPPHGGLKWSEKIALFYRIRKTIKENGSTDTLICFHHGILLRFLISTLFCGLKIICSERNSLTLYKYTKLRKWNIHFFMMFLIHKITVQFPSYRKDYPLLMRRKIHAVHNPVFCNKKPENIERQNILLSIGRLCHQKRFDLLIRSFALVNQQFPDWRMKIIGSGPLHNELIQTIEECNLKDNVDIIEPVTDLTPYFKEARFYCQPSQWEGFPNAQAEAMAAGLIPIGFATTRGVSDLIEDGITGFLCQGDIDVNAYADTITQAITSSEKWNEMSAQAQGICDTYSPQSWHKCWKEVLDL